jgi:hypothetical protein
LQKRKAFEGRGEGLLRLTKQEVTVWPASTQNTMAWVAKTRNREGSSMAGVQFLCENMINSMLKRGRAML